MCIPCPPHVRQVGDEWQAARALGSSSQASPSPTCRHVDMYICLYTYKYKYIYIYVQIYLCFDVYMYVCVHVHLYRCYHRVYPVPATRPSGWRRVSGRASTGFKFSHVSLAADGLVRRASDNPIVSPVTARWSIALTRRWIAVRHGGTLPKPTKRGSPIAEKEFITSVEQACSRTGRGLQAAPRWTRSIPRCTVDMALWAVQVGGVSNERARRGSSISGRS